MCAAAFLFFDSGWSPKTEHLPSNFVAPSLTSTSKNIPPATYASTLIGYPAAASAEELKTSAHPSHGQPLRQGQHSHHDKGGDQPRKNKRSNRGGGRKGNGGRRDKKNKDVSSRLSDYVAQVHAGFTPHDPADMKTSDPVEPRPPSPEPEPSPLSYQVLAEPTNLNLPLSNRENRTYVVNDSEEEQPYVIYAPRTATWLERIEFLITTGEYSRVSAEELCVFVPRSLVQELCAVMVPVRSAEDSWLMLAQCKVQELLMNADISVEKLERWCRDVPLVVHRLVYHRYAMHRSIYASPTILTQYEFEDRASRPIFRRVWPVVKVAAQVTAAAVLVWKVRSFYMRSKAWYVSATTKAQ